MTRPIMIDYLTCWLFDNVAALFRFFLFFSFSDLFISQVSPEDWLPVRHWQYKLFFSNSVASESNF